MSTEPRKGLSEPMIGALLRRAAEATRQELFARLRAAGYDDVRDSHLAVFKFPGPHGLSPTKLADQVGLSKQALNPLLNDLVDAGYLTREPGGDDGRTKVVELAARGEELLAEAESILSSIELRLRAELGEAQFGAFRAALQRIPELVGKDLSVDR